MPLALGEPLPKSRILWNDWRSIYACVPDCIKDDGTNDARFTVLASFLDTLKEVLGDGGDA